MKIVTQEISIRAPVEKVFDAYVNHIDEWWPWQGAQYRFTFAPKGIDPKHIRFEAKPGGRFYETFANGDEYVIGHVKEWQPPSKLVYTWKDPSWNADTLIEVSFKQTGAETMLSLRHSGFDALAQPGMAEGYQQGSVEVYGAFKSWVEVNFVRN
jgi:uncharacterized protein YndB with AHSA1/START domain